MNKRSEKTIEYLYSGFAKILKEKPYNDITVQDILDASHVSRSTFYAHYKTKEELLLSVCSHIFNHVFSHTLDVEKTHDFSQSSIFDYKHLITHIFYHIRDEKDLIDAIFASESKNIFLDYMKNELVDFAKICISSDLIENKQIPSSLKEKQFLNNFVVTLDYWQQNQYQETPEILTDYFIKLF